MRFSSLTCGINLSCATSVFFHPGMKTTRDISSKGSRNCFINNRSLLIIIHGRDRHGNKVNVFTMMFNNYLSALRPHSCERNRRSRTILITMAGHADETEFSHPAVTTACP